MEDSTRTNGEMTLQLHKELTPSAPGCYRDRAVMTMEIVSDADGNGDDKCVAMKTPI